MSAKFRSTFRPSPNETAQIQHTVCYLQQTVESVRLVPNRRRKADNVRLIAFARRSGTATVVIR
jgi:hypothetical protein